MNNEKKIGKVYITREDRERGREEGGSVHHYQGTFALSHRLKPDRIKKIYHSQLWNAFHKRENVVPACRRSVENFGLDYVDLYFWYTGPYLMRAPKVKFYNGNEVPILGLGTWKASFSLVDRGHIVIPKSVTKSRIAQNMDIFDFKLSPKDVAYIDTFDCDGRMCALEKLCKCQPLLSVPHSILSNQNEQVDRDHIVIPKSAVKSRII
ncbi:hypothetical protein DBV15_00781 [Temnothorax longispinosus]|uniref:Uncharacterized protein n=1 Tax=Temnothorax longispinosus TaxID=300112 RepID=A0A4S2KKX8_9HYME|nr:hypothetical protein DBV15_00781 [Temnothorax longispinosus]